MIREQYSKTKSNPSEKQVPSEQSVLAYREVCTPDFVYKMRQLIDILQQEYNRLVNEGFDFAEEDRRIAKRIAWIKNKKP